MWKKEKSSDKKKFDFKVEIDLELYVHNTEEEWQHLKVAAWWAGDMGFVFGFV